MNNDILEKKEKFNLLLQIYGSLLTTNTRRRMESFYFDDLSLFEIAENENVSKNAIFQSITLGEKEILKYEDKLHIYEKSKQISKLLDQIKTDDKKEILKIKEDYLYGI